MIYFVKFSNFGDKMKTETKFPHYLKSFLVDLPVPHMSTLNWEKCPVKMVLFQSKAWKK